MPEERTPYNSPALTYRSSHYPRFGFEGQEQRVPLRVRTTQDVHSDFPGLFGPPLLCLKDEIYECWVNSHGAVSAFTDGGILGLKPDEFTVVEYHPSPPTQEAEAV